MEKPKLEKNIPWMARLRGHGLSELENTLGTKQKFMQRS
jgi:hypothetical protein